MRAFHCLAALALTALLLCPASPCMAFDSFEHEQLSDLAFHLAKRIYCEALPEDPKLRETRQAGCIQLGKTFWDPLEDAAKPALMSRAPTEGVKPDLMSQGPTEGAKPDLMRYGQVVACVDYFLTPEKMLASLRSTASPMQRRQSSQVFSSDSARYPGSNVPSACLDSIFNSRYDQASHSNHAHFQQELLLSYFTYRQLAHALMPRACRPAAAGAEACTPFRGLVANAIADHYLMDYFAPGHITTARSIVTDVVANSLHDYPNIGSEDGQVRLQFLTGHIVQRIDTIWRGFQGKAEASEWRWFWNPHDETGDVLRRYQLPQAQSFPDWAAFMRCAVDPQLRCDSLPVSAAKDGPDSLPASAANDRADSLLVRGDGHLWSGQAINPVSAGQAADAQTRQRVLMLLTQIEGLLALLSDIGAASVPADDWPHGEPGWWQSGAMESSKDQFILATLDQDIQYDLRVKAHPVHLHDADPKEYAGAGQGSQYTPHHVKIVGLNAEFDAVQSGNTHLVSRVGLTGGPFLGYITEGFDAGGTAAIESVYENGRASYGLGFNPGAIFPATETGVSFPLEWIRHHRNEGPDSTRFDFGIRVEQGFTSFLTLFLQTSYRYVPQSGGGLLRSITYGAGVSIAAPWCRVPKVKSWLAGDC